MSIEHERGKSVPFSDNSNNREEQFWARISVFLSKKKKEQQQQETRSSKRKTEYVKQLVSIND